jgi:hypothetical protein
MIETAGSVLLLALSAPFGLLWVAISRFAHGILFMLIYAPMMQEMLGFRWRDLALIYARSLLATAAAVTPVLLSYVLWHPASEAGLVQMFSMVVAGGVCWLITLKLAGHPLFAEIAAMLGEITASLRQRRARTA